jgi:hypothetical protein
VDGFLLLLVLGWALGARAWYVSACCHRGADEGPYQVQDGWQEERDTLVRNLSEGRRLVSRAPLAEGEETTAHTSFVYPLLLSLLDRPAGDLAVTYQRMRWIQVFLGGLSAGLYFLIARRAFQSRWVATLTGLLCAVHPFWIVNAAEINDGVLATFLVGLGLFLGVRSGQQGGALTSLLFGLVLATLGSIRVALLPFGFVALLWFLLRSRELARGWMYALLAVLGFVNGLIPWMTQTYQSFGEVSALASPVFLHFWIGNNSRATGGPETETAMVEALADQDPNAEGLRQMTQVTRYRALARAAWREIRSEPGAALQRRLFAGVSFFLGERWLQERKLVREDPGAIEEVPDWLSRSATALFAGSLLVMLVLGAIGWRWSFSGRRVAMPTSLAPFWIFLPYLLTHADSFHGPRLPLDGMLLCYAALAVCWLAPTAEEER